MELALTNGWVIDVSFLVKWGDTRAICIDDKRKELLDKGFVS